MIADFFWWRYLGLHSNHFLSTFFLKTGGKKISGGAGSS
jgi:hypothetical protein